MDRNAKKHSQSLDYQYHRRYRKQTKNWDAVKVMEAKEYKYIPDLIEEILKYWQESISTMKSKNTVDTNHPQHNQRTIAHIEPPDTHIIVSKKKSRFT